MKPHKNINQEKEISAFTVSLSFNLEPIYSIVLAIILFREDRVLGAVFYAGLSLIALSLLLQMPGLSSFFTFNRKTQ